MIAIDCIGKLGFIMRILVAIVKYVKILVPILLIVMIVFDLVKVVVGNVDDKAKKEASGRAVKRLMYAVIVFLIPTIVKYVFITLEPQIDNDNNGTPTSWISCWNYYDK